MANNNILSYLQGQQENFISMLREFVELESPSHENKEVSDKCCDFLEKAFGGLGFNIQRLKQPACGDHLYGELGTGEGSTLIVGHYDTVYPLGTLGTMPFIIEEGGKIARGPGILDMKGGIIMAFFAIKALIELGVMPDKKIGFFFNSDEESGSFYSSDLILGKASMFRSVLVMEPGVNDKNSVKIHRYGRGTYAFTAYGTSAHSGSNSHLAVSPLLELAHQLLYLEQWNKEIAGVTFAPTYIQGGIPGTCVVPETAHFTIDVRYKTEELAKTVHEQILSLKPLTPHIRLSIEGQLDKPVMAADPTLYKKAVEIGQKFGLALKGVSIGGGSDGNFTAAAGIPTLDGLGMTGEFLHNPKEYVHLDCVPARTALTAELLRTL